IRCERHDANPPRMLATGPLTAGRHIPELQGPGPFQEGMTLRREHGRSDAARREGLAIRRECQGRDTAMMSAQGSHRPAVAHVPHPNLTDDAWCVVEPYLKLDVLGVLGEHGADGVNEAVPCLYGKTTRSCRQQTTVGRYRQRREQAPRGMQVGPDPARRRVPE